ncbi:MAG: electron transfer flavoprotein subunit beta/FixA family protein [Spirochaetaceae bacterium]|jgi:electron transfer flavoprotein beta subunit|nr:electron transfer flavoprotein subunit beta/FixA family protein [Spirochaetaceae bacterium]
MRIACLLKFVPDTDNLVYNDEGKLLWREKMELTLNPDDSSALAWALALRKSGADGEIEIDALSMAPPKVADAARDLLRIGTDRFFLISDPLFAGSDTLATSRVLVRGITMREAEAGRYDLILCGTRSLDGDTSHIPAQIAALLGRPVITGVYRLSLAEAEGQATAETDDEDSVFTWGLRLPAVAGFVRRRDLRLPFVRYADLDKDVDDRLYRLSNAALGLKPEETGLAGSRTRVERTFAKTLPAKKQTVVYGSGESAAQVLALLRENGFPAEVA